MTNEVKQTEADLIWNEIKDMSIDIYSLPNQKVEDHVKKLKIPGDQLLLTLNSSAVLPALETTITRRGFEIEQGEKFTIVRRVEKPVDLSSLVEEPVLSAAKKRPGKR